MHKKDVTEKRGENITKNANEDTKRENFKKKELNTIEKNREKSSTIETKFDKNGNKVSMHETVKAVDQEKIIKENIKSLTRDNKTLLQYDNVEDIGEIKNSLMIEAGVTKKNEKLENLRMILCIY